jgi:hypothetical protein
VTGPAKILTVDDEPDFEALTIVRETSDGAGDILRRLAG